MLRIVDHGVNRGYGAALRSGFAAARGEWVFYTDGDGQYDPAELERLIAQVSDEVDVVQGWKLGRNDSALRAVVGRAYHHAVRLLFGLPVRDTDCDFRLIRASALERVDPAALERRDLRRDAAQARPRRRALHRGRRAPLRASVRTLAVLPRRPRGALAARRRRCSG